MAVSSRKVKNKRDSNGVLTGKAGTVYDVEFKYKTPDGDKTYSKGGFATKGKRPSMSPKCGQS